MFFKRKSVDSVLSSFDKMIADLERIREGKIQEMAKCTIAIRDLDEQQKVAAGEADRAKIVAQRLINIIKE